MWDGRGGPGWVLGFPRTGFLSGPLAGAGLFFETVNRIWRMNLAALPCGAGRWVCPKCVKLAEA